MNISDELKTKLLSEIREVLLRFPIYWDDGNLIEGKLIHDLRNYEKALIEALLANDLIKKTYAITVGTNTMFKLDEFISMLRFRQYWGSDYTKYTNDIGLTSEGKYINYNEDVVIDFPYKDSVLEAGMTKGDVGKEEVFYHNVLAKEEIDTLLEPKVLTNMTKYDEFGEHNVTEIKDTDNLLIKGNNLIGLTSLTKRYKGKIKTVFLDPPYLFEKTQKEDDFLYNSNFKNSTWLVFMKNRIESTLKLLKAGGFLVVQMNDNGVFMLKSLLDEIFNTETRGGFVNHITVKMSDLSGPKMAHVEKRIPKIKEHILIYTNDYDEYHFNPTKIKSTWDESIDSKRYTSFVEKNNSADIENWTYTTVRQKLKSMGLEYGEDKAYDFLLNNAECVFRTAANPSLKKLSINNKYNPDKFTKITTATGLEKYVYKNEEVIFATSKLKEINGTLTPTESVSDIWTDIALNDLSNEGGVDLKNGKKPEALLQRIIELTTSKDDFVLDFFMGTATTQAVAMKMERRFIGIEQMDYIKDKSVQRLRNVINGESRGISRSIDWQGGGSFIYAELYELNKRYVQDILATESDAELDILLDKLLETEYLNFKTDFKKLSNRDGLFQDLALEQKKEILIKILDLNQLYLNYSEIDDNKHGINEDVKQFNHSFYQVEVNEDEQE